MSKKKLTLKKLDEKIDKEKKERLDSIIELWEGHLRILKFGFKCFWGNIVISALIVILAFLLYQGMVIEPLLTEPEWDEICVEKIPIKSYFELRDVYLNEWELIKISKTE